MKKREPQKAVVTLEHVSVTVSQCNQDQTGKQTVNRVYWSTRKKISQAEGNSHNLMPKASSATEKSIHRGRLKKQEPFEKYTQLSLFPSSKQ